MFLGWFGLVRQVSRILVTSGLNGFLFFFLMQDVKQIYDSFSQIVNCNRLMEAHFHQVHYQKSHVQS